MEDGKVFTCSLQTLERRIGKYFDRCEADGRKPTANGLCLAAGITPAQLLEQIRMLEGGERPEGFQYGHALALKRGQMRLCDYLEQQSDSMSILKAKQPLYCGYVEKPVQVQDAPALRVTLKMDSPDGPLNPGL